MMDWCQYFEADPNFPDLVSMSPHDAVPDLYFFVPVGNKDAVRVSVCREHCDVLEKLYA